MVAHEMNTAPGCMVAATLPAPNSRASVCAPLTTTDTTISAPLRRRLRRRQRCRPDRRSGPSHRPIHQSRRRRDRRASARWPSPCPSNLPDDGDPDWARSAAGDPMSNPLVTDDVWHRDGSAATVHIGVWRRCQSQLHFVSAPGRLGPESRGRHGGRGAVRSRCWMSAKAAGGWREHRVARAANQGSFSEGNPRPHHGRRRDARLCAEPDCGRAGIPTGSPLVAIVDAVAEQYRLRRCDSAAVTQTLETRPPARSLRRLGIANARARRRSSPRCWPGVRTRSCWPASSMTRARAGC